MTEDIWAEKPESFEILPDAEELRYEAHRKFYSVDGMDAFHEKLKSSFDESMADCHHSLELVAAKLGEYREKAEKYDVVNTFIEATQEDAYVHLNLATKLEAVKTWVKRQPQYGEGGLEELEKILEGEE